MLPKAGRLTSADVKEVLAHGRAVRGDAVSLKYIVNKGFFRAAAVVPKSVAKRAVDRNRLRRTVYRTIASLSLTNTTPPHNIMAVFFVRSLTPPHSTTLRDAIIDIVSKIPGTHV